MKVLHKLLAQEFARKAQEIKAACQPSEVGTAKDGSTVLGYTPEQRVRMKTAETLEQIAKDLSNPPEPSLRQASGHNPER